MSSLYTICLDRIHSFLKEGMWKSCISNPFSGLPAKFVNELMDLSDDATRSSKIGGVLLLLTSGKLKRLDLSSFDLKQEDSIIKTMGSISSPNLASHSEEHIIQFVRNVISWNPNLEEFHSYIHPGFDVFLKCPNLRILKIYSPFSKFPINNAPMDLSIVSSLRNLEVLEVFNMDADTIANVLETCTKLISIGWIDSLDGLEEIAQRRKKNSLLNLDVGRHFQLRRCVWGKQREPACFINRNKKQECNSSFRCKVRSAVELCPLVQKLIINVHQKDGYDALRFLKELTFLRIDFENCHCDVFPDFFALLREIGPQLKHLSVFGKDASVRSDYPIPVDVICDCCPLLESLEVWSWYGVSMEDSSKSCRDLTLKRLTFVAENKDFSEEESLLFLLCNSKHLEELYIEAALSLDETLLNRILEKNPFSQLKVIVIEESSLSKEGFQMLLEKLPSIEEKHFFDASRFKDASLYFTKDYYRNVSDKQFFWRHLNRKCF